MTYEIKPKRKMIDKNNIPTHDLSADYKINTEFISHKNTYDSNQIHKHNYYEILFFEKGGGFQQIDFNKIPVKNFSCYIVKPRQVHLVKKKPEADGLLIQFTDTMILPDVFLNSLSILKLHLSSEILFEENESTFNNFLSSLHSIQKLGNNKPQFYKEKTVHLLSNLLYSLEEIVVKERKGVKLLNNDLIFKFIELVEQYLNSLSIKEYADKLGVSTKKLTSIIKEQFDVTPLKYIHNILLLNIKRDLVFKKLSHKEIAYNYNFDSPSNFSLFIKKHTGLTPTKLQELLNSF